jgi:hypothetical protein
MIIPAFFTTEYLPAGVHPEVILSQYNMLLVVLFLIMTVVFYKIQTIDHR